MKRLFYLIPIAVLVLIIGISHSCIINYKLLNLKLQLSQSQVIHQKLFKNGMAISENLKVSKKEFDNALTKLQVQDSRITDLQKELKKDRYKIKTVTVVKTTVVPKPIYITKEKSDSSSGSKYSKDIFYKFKNSQLRLASITFDTKDKLWDYKLIPFSLNLVILRSTSKNKLSKYGATATLSSEGKDYPIPISSFKTKELIEKKSAWSLSLSPLSLKFSLFLSLAPNQVSYSLAVSSYLLKLYNIDNVKSFQFLGIGFGYTNPYIISGYILPVSFNLNSIIPLIKNTYITIGLGFNYDLPNNLFFLSGVIGISFEF